MPYKEITKAKIEMITTMLTLQVDKYNPDDITTTKSVLTMTKLPITTVETMATMTTVMMKKVKG